MHTGFSKFLKMLLALQCRNSTYLSDEYAIPAGRPVEEITYSG